MNKKNIPIKDAENISKKNGYPIVIIFAYDPETGNENVTTYGETRGHCLEAAKAGNCLKESLGWPKNLCHAKPEKNILEGKR